MSILLFGSNNPTGAAFLQICKICKPTIWGRNPGMSSGFEFIYCDLREFRHESVQEMNGVLVSFAPIWLLAPFLANLAREKPESFSGLKGILACSSSSYITKRFAFNDHDKELSLTLANAHLLLNRISMDFNLSCQILAPTLVYGKVNEYTDKNINRLIHILRKVPCLFLPKTTGLRQPIHATQLASVAYRQAEKMLSGSWSGNSANILLLGGDSLMSYHEMLIQIQKSLNTDDPAHKCPIFTIPDTLFYFLSAPILSINPKLGEAILRIKSNLSGFTMAHEILNEAPKAFPVLPLCN